MQLAFSSQQIAWNKVLVEGKLPDGTLILQFVTGDLAFLNAFYGICPPMSSYENGSVWFVGKKGQRKTRELDCCYKLSHGKPPYWDFKRHGVLKCRCCDFEATCDKDLEAEIERIKSMSDDARRKHQASHEGNIPGQFPIAYIPPDQCMPPIQYTIMQRIG